MSARTDTTDPTELTSRYVLSLAARLGADKREIPARNLEKTVVRHLVEHSQADKLRFSYSPYVSLIELIGSLSASGAVTMSEPPSETLRLTAAGQRIVRSNGDLEALSKELGFTQGPD